MDDASVVISSASKTITDASEVVEAVIRKLPDAIRKEEGIITTRSAQPSGRAAYARPRSAHTGSQGSLRIPGSRGYDTGTEPSWWQPVSPQIPTPINPKTGLPYTSEEYKAENARWEEIYKNMGWVTDKLPSAGNKQLPVTVPWNQIVNPLGQLKGADFLKNVLPPELFGSALWDQLSEEVKISILKGNDEYEMWLADRERQQRNLFRAKDAYGRIIDDYGTAIGDGMAGVNQVLYESFFNIAKTERTASDPIKLGSDIMSDALQQTGSQVAATAGKAAIVLGSTTEYIQSLQMQLDDVMKRLAGGPFVAGNALYEKAADLQRRITASSQGIYQTAMGAAGQMASTFVAGRVNVEPAYQNPWTDYANSTRPEDLFMTGKSPLQMNFYGVTDPNRMADKIVTGLRVRGVDI
jgi:hypothetical protein